MPNQPLPGVAVATKTETTTRVATTAALTVATTAIALSMGMSAALFGFAAAGTNTNTSASGGGGGGAISGDPSLVAVGDQFVRGNANDDGYINVSDANFILSFLYNYGGKPVCMDAADVNDDGRVDLSDAKYLMDFLFNGTQPAPKAPWPARGVDPTADSLGCKPIPPFADAGADSTAVSGTLVTLDGTGHPGEVGHLIAFTWRQVAGPAVSFTTSTAIPQPQFIAPVVTVSTALTFTMTVTDAGLGLSSSDSVTVTVLPCAPNWQCAAWSACLNGSQTRTCVDANSCGTSTGKPATTQSCTQAPLTVTRAPNSPEAGLLPGNTSGITVGTFSLAANGEGVRVERLWLTGRATNSSIRPAGAWNQVNAIYLYDGNTLIHSVSPTSTNRTDAPTLLDLTNNPIEIAAGAVKQITVKVDTANVSRYPRANRGVSGQGFEFLLRPRDVTAKSMTTGGSISDITTDGGNSGASLNPMTVYVSVPTIATNDQLGQAGITSGTLSTATAKNLYRFRVKADSAGDVGLFQVSFLVTTSTATATNLHIHDGTKVVASRRDMSRTVRTHDLGSVAIFSFIFTTDGQMPRPSDPPNTQPVSVLAGGVKTFTLRGDLGCSSDGQIPCAGSTGSGSVQFQFLGDSSFPWRYPDSTTYLAGHPYENSLIWGDFAVSGPLGVASTTAKTAEQWTNGFLVASEAGKLPATSTAVTFSR